ncbi:MAG: M28 family peptidase [Acidobacteria bacterium]|nr:M28 family peptidase [Acidobacteriota bacterium]
MSAAEKSRIPIRERMDGSDTILQMAYSHRDASTRRQHHPSRSEADELPDPMIEVVIPEVEIHEHPPRTPERFLMTTSRLNPAVLLTTLLFLTPACAGQSMAPASGAAPAPRGTPAETTDFSASRALDHVQRLVEMGPRPVGSLGHDRMRDYILAELKKYGLKILRDDFQATTPLGEKSMTNIIGILPGVEEGFMMVAGHYDTKYFKSGVFVGANDGGSSTAALLEIARTMAQQAGKPKHTTWFVFLDGEEAFCWDWYECLNGKDHTYGSRHLAEKMVRDGTIRMARALVLIDMIGDKDLGLDREIGYSTPSITDIIWETAESLGYGLHFLPSGQSVADDHVPFLENGLPAVDLIDFRYPYWHTVQDTVDKVSGDSMKIVGDVVIKSLAAIYDGTAARKR